MMTVPAALDELLDYLTPAERALLDEDLVAMDAVGVSAGARVGAPVPAGWRARLQAVYPKHVGAPFAKRHEDFWDYIESIEPDSAPDPEVDIWPRGGGKSTGAELAASDLGCRGKRFYCLYVRETQDMADKSVANIAALLESPEVERHYPAHADRMVGKYGNAKGWRRERLTTAGGYTIDAAGLDTATRGLKFENQRPDLIIFDDIDGKFDGPHITAKKRDIITHSILPAGSNNCAIIFIQNLIIPDGIATQLADGRADFLVNRRVSGPHPAVEGLKYEWKLDEKTGIRRAVITAGTATWAGQPLAACQTFINTWGLSAFLKEAQHLVKGRAEGIALRFDAGRHFIDLTDDECRQLIADGLRSKKISVFGAVDFGAWRFAFTLWVVRSDGVLIRIDEYFAQRIAGEMSLSERAQAIHELCEWYDIPAAEKGIPIWGDAANPTDILELSLAFKNGWLCEWEDDQGRHEQFVTSKLRVVAVAAENKLRIASVDRINNLLDKNVIRYRRAVSYEWRYNMNASSEGTAMQGSRLIWEMENWSYLPPKPGEEQDQDPDDKTADGADAIATHRYGVMSVWSKTQLPQGMGVQPEDQAPPFDFTKRKFVPKPHVADLLIQSGRKMPTVKMPRPRTSR
jgi:hypothetical protein